MKWISINTRKPKLGQKCYCYYVMARHDGTVLKDTRLLYYLKLKSDNRQHVFADKNEIWYDMGMGEVDWPVTHWMPEPEYPTNAKDIGGKNGNSNNSNN